MKDGLFGLTMKVNYRYDYGMNFLEFIAGLLLGIAIGVVVTLVLVQHG